MAQTDCPEYYPLGEECGYRNTKGIYCFNTNVKELACPYIEPGLPEPENKIEPDNVDGRRLEPLS